MRTATPAVPVDTLPTTKVAFQSRRDGPGEIYVLQSDGSQLNITNDPSEDQNPDWSPDGTKIAYSSNRAGTFDIYVANADGSGLVKLTDDGAGDESPRWSPDGKRIAFSRVGSLMVMDSDGGNVSMVLKGESEFTASSLCETGGFVGGWSPDGTELVFYASSLRQDIGHICIVDLDGANLRTVASEPPGYHVEPSWSPDGERIAYRAILEENHEICVVDADGTSTTNLTSNQATDIEPDWAPDGDWIVFSSNRSDDFELYAISSDGSELLRLTADPGKDSEPSWSPR